MTRCTEMQDWPRLVVGEGGDAGGGPVEVGVGGVVGEDDGRGVAAQLQGDVLARHRVQDRVADRAGAGEGDRPAAAGPATRRGHAVVGDRQDATRSRPGRSVSASSSPSSSAGQRGGRGGLEDDRRADGDAPGRPCARTRLSGKLNGAMPSTGPVREAADEREPARGRRRRCPAAAASPPSKRRASSAAQRKVETARPTSPRAHLIGLPFSAVISAAISSARSASRRDDVVEGGGPDVGGGGGEPRPDGCRGGDGLLDLGGGRHARPADERGRPRGGDIEAVVAGGLAAGEPEGVVAETLLSGYTCGAGPSGVEGGWGWDGWACH